MDCRSLHFFKNFMIEALTIYLQDNTSNLSRQFSLIHFDPTEAHKLLIDKY